jgi:UDP-3-O-[3-hydroxymyristoyl] N-acetylglucosamine deacetylase
VLDPAASGPLRLGGTALHSGAAVAVTLVLSAGPIVFQQRRLRAPLSELVAVRTDRGVTVASPGDGVRIDLVEHLLAALGGLGVRRGLRVEVEGDELPILDGGAARFCAALASAGVVRGAAPELVVARAGEIAHGGSTYRFAPGPSVELSVEIEFRSPVGKQRASWSGDADDFERRVAPARTFGWLDELAALRASGRAHGASEGVVLVLSEGGAPVTSDEPARHKLLDLIGDFALYGGPPRGRVEATRPGHTATHAVIASALRAGVLTRSRTALEG